MTWPVNMVALATQELVDLLGPEGAFTDQFEAVDPPEQWWSQASQAGRLMYAKLAYMKSTRDVLTTLAGA